MTENMTRTVGHANMTRRVSLVTIEGHDFLTDGTLFFSECGRCPDASGFFNCYSGIYEGICYSCHGTGIDRTYDSEAHVLRIAKRRNADRARADRKAAEKSTAQAAEHAAWVTANPELATRLSELSDEINFERPGITTAEYHAAIAAYKNYGDFITSLALRSICASLTEKQAAAVTEALAEFDAKVAADAEKRSGQRVLDAELGAKVEVTGTVAVAMNVDGYAYNSTDRMLVIEGTGEFTGCTFKITGSGKTLWDADRGDEVTVAATVKKFAEYKGTPQTILTRAKIAVAA